MKSRAVIFTMVCMLTGMAGCRVQVDKSNDGQAKNVRVDTPMGGMHVRTDTTTAADLGLPVYPGAKEIAGDGDSKSANVQVGFGKWQVRVKVVNYTTPDAQDKVVAFYRKALGRYGDVIECHGDKAVGAPAETREGLTCQDKGGGHHANVDMDSDRTGLKAGSEHRQHIMEIKREDAKGTEFALVALELPDTGAAVSQ